MFACGAPSAKPTTIATAPPPSSSIADAATSSTAIAVVPGAPPAPSGPPNAKLFAELPSPDEAYISSRPIGFTSDDVYLAEASSSCDPCPITFHLTSPGKPSVDFGYFYDPGNPRASALQPKHDAEVEKKLKAYGLAATKGTPVLRGPFPYPDLIFATAVDRNDLAGKKALLFGAKVEGYAPVFPMRIEIAPHSMFHRVPASQRSQFLMQDPTLAYANVTKGGSEIGAIAIATGSMWEEHSASARMSAGAFAAHVYNGTGMRFHQAKKFVESGKLFEKAEAANPTDALFPYNLACALAQTKDSRAKDALARAIQRGGAPIKARAKADKDFEPVVTEPWFVDLVK